jgi:hypothetical protein
MRMAAWAVAAWLLLAPGAQGQGAGGSVLETIEVPANGHKKGAVSLKAGTEYTVTVAGTRQWSDNGRGHQSDAFYCFEDPSKSQCGAVPSEELTIHVVSRAGKLTALSKHFAGGKAPPYSPSHTYTGTFTPDADGPLELTTAITCGGPPRQCTGPGFTVTIHGTADNPSACTGDHCVTVSGVTRKVEVSRNEGSWEPAIDGMKLSSGDRIHTGFKAGVTLTFVDGSTVAIKQMSLLQLESVSRSTDGVLHVRGHLRLGEVAAEVNRSSGSAADFNIKTPTSTASIRGTKLTVFYDGIATLVAVTEGTVHVAPNTGAAVDVAAGSQVSATAHGVSAPVPIGTGEKRGGLTAGKALALINSKITAGLRACKFDVVSNRLAPSAGGWSAQYVIVGSTQGVGDKPKGTARFRLKGKKLSGGNALGKKILKRCR